MVTAEDAVSLYRRLSDQGIRIWLTGGWGVDALLGEQSRPHKDLDAILLLDDMVRMGEILGQDGYGLKELWSENRWTVDKAGNTTATAYVLHDEEDREFDVHAICLDEHGDGIPAWEEAGGLVFRKEDLAEEGIIAGHIVKCISPEAQVQCHRGYELPEAHVHDLNLLREKFGVEVPT